jgi:hypothetical protein
MAADAGGALAGDQLPDPGAAVARRAAAVAGGRGVVGLYLLSRGEFAAAREQLERALHLKEAAYGPDHPQVATTLATSESSWPSWGIWPPPALTSSGPWRSARPPSAPTTPTSPPFAVTLTLSSSNLAESNTRMPLVGAWQTVVVQGR